MLIFQCFYYGLQFYLAPLGNAYEHNATVTKNLMCEINMSTVWQFQ